MIHDWHLVIFDSCNFFIWVYSLKISHPPYVLNIHFVIIYFVFLYNGILQYKMIHYYVTDIEFLLQSTVMFPHIVYL